MRHFTRHFMIVLLLLLPGAGALAQDRTPASGEGGHFGAPVIKVTAIRNQTAVMFGGRGGWNVNPFLVVGGGLYGTMTEVNAPDGVPDAPGPLDVKMESFGLELEYAPRPAAPTHLTLHAFLGGGAVHYVRDKTNEQHGETDFILVLEPAVGVERRLTDWLHVNLAGSYRVVGGVEQPGLEDGDLNAPAATLAVKLGRF